MIVGGLQSTLGAVSPRYLDNMIFNDQNIDIKNNPNGVLYSFYGCTVLSTILEPGPIAVAKELSSGSSSCTSAVTVVEVGEKTSWQPTQDKAV